MRVSGGVIFAYDRHFARMTRDARLMRVPFPGDPEYLRSRLLRLIEANQAQNATLRVAVIRNKGGVFQAPNLDREFDVVAFTSDLMNWGDGVKLMTVPHGRHAAARERGTKVLSWSSNLYWYEESHAQGYDEVIFLNEHGEVSECTSANLFGVFGNQVWTPPLDSGCLPGVTRAILHEEIHVPGISVGEKTLQPADLFEADEVFITSTTRNLHPVLSIDGKAVKRSGNVRKSLDAAFVRNIEDHVCSKTI
jgi:branched-chain amino acid aminotransferase